MNEIEVMFYALLIRGVVLCSITAGVVILALNNKDGWGWLIVLGVILATTTYSYKPDAPLEEPATKLGGAHD
jgi:uncharacterized membrane protein HdeD (DUF308 family)